MKTRIFMIVTLLIALGLAGCAGPKVEPTPAKAMPPLGMPPPEGKAFWTYISVTNPYTSWGSWPGYEGMYEGKSPHGAYLRLYANDIAISAAKAGQKTLPNGAIIVKENYGKDKKTMMAITPMYKVMGYNPAGGDWFWAKYAPNGEVGAAGKPKGCVECHGAVKGDDWLFSKIK